MPEITVADARALVVGHWLSTGQMSPQSIDKFDGLLERFAGLADAFGTARLVDVGPPLVESFIRARGRDRRGDVTDAAVATMQGRRSVLRAFYRTARDLSLTWEDPARDVVLPPRPPSDSRPLSADEVELVWFHAWAGGRTTRHASTIAMLLCGAHTSEVGYVTLAQVDLDAGVLDAPGGSKFQPRRLPIAPRYVEALAARRDHLLARPGAFDSADIVLATGAGGSPAHLQARICMTVAESLRRAGLGDDPRLRPSSVTAFPARAVFEETGQIERAAKLLGMSSLDATARAIGWAWLGDD